MGIMDWLYLKKLGSPKSEDWDVALEKLKDTTAPRVVEALIKFRLRQGGTGWGYSTLQILRSVSNPQCASAFAGALQSENEDILEVAIERLGAMQAHSTTPQILRVLAQGPPKIRHIAADALGQLGSGDTCPVLRTTLLGAHERLRKRDWSDGDVYALSNLEIACVKALTKLKDSGSVELLATVMSQSGNWQTSRACAFGLGYIGDKRAVPYLIVALKKGGVWEERESAAHALGSLRDPSAREALETATHDEHESVRTAAAKALASLA